MSCRCIALLCAGSLALAACSSAPKKPEASRSDRAADRGAVQVESASIVPLTDEAPITEEQGKDEIAAMRVGDLLVLHKKTAANDPIVAAQLYYIGGVERFEEDDAGIERMALQVAASGGTTTTPKDEFARALARRGASIGASSGRDASVLYMASAREDFDEIFELFTQVALEPAMPRAEVELERQRQLAQIAQIGQSADSLLGYSARQMFYQGHPYRQMQIGTAENVARFMPDDLRSWLASISEPARMLLVVVGDLETRALAGKVAAGLGRLPAGEVGERDAIAAPTPPSDPVSYVAFPGAATNYILGLAPGPAPGSEEYAAALMASEYLGDKLFEEVRTKRNLTYAVSAGLGSHRANTVSLYVTATDPAATLPVMFAEIERLKSRPLSESDLEATRNVFLTSHYMSQQSNAGQASALGNAYVETGDWREAEGLVERVRRITPAEIQAAAERYFDGFTFVAVGADPSAVPPALVSRPAAAP